MAVCILNLVETSEVSALYRKHSASFSTQELTDVKSFREIFFDATEGGESTRRNFWKQVTAGIDSWGNPHARGGDKDCWDDIDATSFKVRGPNYVTDRKKAFSERAICDLCVVDLFESDTDIEHNTASRAAGTIRRLRDSGELRRLFIINFRIVPIHFVIVFAFPQQYNMNDPSVALLNEFMSENMDDAERTKRLKAIPRVVEGPWVAKGLLGETPGIVGKNIPIQYHVGENEIEASIQCTASGFAQRMVRVLKPAASALTIELAFVIQGNTPEELPEQILGGCRITSPNVALLRCVKPDEN